ncbi:hypothetical protein Scep_030036 [Stephania cephalantha]|uniref:Uncharacterized protein n=1 Tax=Stephania cephalantha TaxID=152367 RepID=A0AAP0HI68_9MAGN
MLSCRKLITQELAGCGQSSTPKEGCIKTKTHTKQGPSLPTIFFTPLHILPSIIFVLRHYASPPAARRRIRSLSCSPPAARRRILCSSSLRPPSRSPIRLTRRPCRPLPGRPIIPINNKQSEKIPSMKPTEGVRTLNGSLVVPQSSENAAYRYCERAGILEVDDKEGG